MYCIAGDLADAFWKWVQLSWFYPLFFAPAMTINLDFVSSTQQLRVLNCNEYLLFHYNG